MFSTISLGKFWNFIILHHKWLYEYRYLKDIYHQTYSFNTSIASKYMGTKVFLGLICNNTLTK